MTSETTVPDPAQVFPAAPAPAHQVPPHPVPAHPMLAHLLSSGPATQKPVAYHRLAWAVGRCGWWRPVAGTVLVLVGVLALMLVLAVGAQILGEVAHRPLDSDGVPVWGDVGDMALALLSIAVATPVVLLVARCVQRRPAGTVSSVSGRLRVGRLAVCLALALPLVVVGMGVQVLLPAPSGSGGEEAVWAGASTFLAGLAAVWVLVPFQAAAEEYVFRGWLLQAVGAWWRSPWVAIAPQALLFAAAHGWGTPWGFADLVVFGTVTGWLTVRTGGLEAAIALHILNNLVAMSIAAAIAGALGSPDTAADMGWRALAVDAPMVLLYAAAVLCVTRRRERASGTDERTAPLHPVTSA
ncbi:lysostaphin resistance A-like protein [Streptomyces sp. NPDC097617]|uniref:CPBP family intramembrane glutamic endopeptidase n=1 Tax=Streptomyces sp. NPDC097617 TaxID=3366091 RepID=UPI00381931FB